MGPLDVDVDRGLDVGPHPHIGLRTVTWLLDGQVLHRDSLGSEQVIRAGQLNLMSAGRGVVHSEEATGHYRGTLEGIQLWVAQGEQERHGPASFAHHEGLPVVDLGALEATVLVGRLGETRSPADAGSGLVGAEVRLRGGGSLELDPLFEHALITLRGELLVEGRSVPTGRLVDLGTGREELALAGDATVMLLGGEPFPEPLFMWWNFVARTRDEIDEAFTQWREPGERFSSLDSPLARIAAPTPWWRRDED